MRRILVAKAWHRMHRVALASQLCPIAEERLPSLAKATGQLAVENPLSTHIFELRYLVINTVAFSPEKAESRPGVVTPVPRAFIHASTGSPAELSSLKHCSQDTEKSKLIIATRVLCGEDDQRQECASPIRLLAAS
jgi:hypothetical protein